MNHISSLTNPKIKNIVKLRNRRERDKHKLFIVEGYRSVSRGIENNLDFSELYICKDFFIGKNEENIINHFLVNNLSVFSLDKVVFEKIAYRDKPEGLLATAKQFTNTLEDIKLHQNPLIIVAESIEKPGNLGTILRSADAVNVTALIVCDKCTDIFNPNVVRSSTGALFTVPVIEATSSETLSWLKKNKINILAATPHTNFSYTNANMQEAIAIAVGAEQYGLSKNWVENSNIKVKIPMLGKMDSLNVAMATTILLYEALRQRSQ